MKSGSAARPTTPPTSSGRLGEPYGYPSADPGADEHDASMVVRRRDRFDQLLRIGEPLRQTCLLDVTLRASNAVVISHDAWEINLFLRHQVP